MKIYLVLLSLSILSSCGKIPVPSILSPSENMKAQKVSFGEEPLDYQNILKNYLIKNLRNYKTAKVEFINSPSKLSIDHLGSNYIGYRVCLSINEKRGEYYSGYKNHFFLINDNQVDLHLYDSGLLTIPFEYCVSRNKKNEYFIDDIPDKLEEISVESMDSIELTSKENISYKKLQNELDKLKQENIKLRALDNNESELIERSIEDLAKTESTQEVYDDRDNIYISCSFDDIAMTYVFNSSKETFKLINKLDEVAYGVSFNNAYIVATNGNLELTVNRVTGKAALVNKTYKEGMCNLTNKTKF
ncbi:hypothetical protein OAR47_03350 [Gammaproteobacteria bacterium]|nr:hypothetical protein [Gammaproteobacteria bacterium]